MIAAAFLIPVVAVVLALTFAADGDPAAARTCMRSRGSYAATVARPLSVTAFRIANTSEVDVTVTRVRIARPSPGST